MMTTVITAMIVLTMVLMIMKTKTMVMMMTMVVGYNCHESNIHLNNALLHQFSFYLSNVLLSIQLLVRQELLFGPDSVCM